VLSALQFLYVPVKFLHLLFHGRVLHSQAQDFPVLVRELLAHVRDLLDKFGLSLLLKQGKLLV
jgi:hypothetical protein